ncbi:MAG: hypothetical protein U0840_01540 [Gemmataceae bacterium]
MLTSLVMLAAPALAEAGCGRHVLTGLPETPAWLASLPLAPLLPSLPCHGPTCSEQPTDLPAAPSAPVAPSAPDKILASARPMSAASPCLCLVDVLAPATSQAEGRDIFHPPR